MSAPPPRSLPLPSPAVPSVLAPSLAAEAKRVTDVPAGLPCGLCGQHTYGHECPICGGNVCLEHMVGAEQWCARCAADLAERERTYQLPQAVKLGVLAGTFIAVSLAGLGAASNPETGKYQIVGTLLLTLLLCGILVLVGFRLWVRRTFAKKRREDTGEDELGPRVVGTLVQTGPDRIELQPSESLAPALSAPPVIAAPDPEANPRVEIGYTSHGELSLGRLLAPPEVQPAIVYRSEPPAVPLRLPSKVPTLRPDSNIISGDAAPLAVPPPPEAPATVATAPARRPRTRKAKANEPAAPKAAKAPKKSRQRRRPKPAADDGVRALSFPQATTSRPAPPTTPSPAEQPTPASCVGNQRKELQSCAGSGPELSPCDPVPRLTG